MPPIPFVLADVEGIFGVIVLLITVLGWIVNLIQGGKNANNPPPKRGGDGQSELQAFLRQVAQAAEQAKQQAGGGAPAPKPQPEPVALVAERRENDSAFSAPQPDFESSNRQANERRPAERPKPRRDESPRPTSSKPNRPAKRGKSPDGSGATSQRNAPRPSSFRDDRLSANLPSSLGRDGAVGTMTHAELPSGSLSSLSQAAAPGTPPTPASTPSPTLPFGGATMNAAQLAAMLRQPAGFQAAFLLGELMQGPVARRKRRTAPQRGSTPPNE